MDSDDDIPDLVDNSSSDGDDDSDDDDNDSLPELVAAPPNYYCHICAVPVIGHINTTSLEAECDQCQSNFVESLGQGHEHFLNPDLPRPPPQRRNLTTYSSAIGRDRRTPPPARQGGASHTPHIPPTRTFPRGLAGGTGLNNIMNALFMGGAGGGDVGGSAGAGFFGGPLGMIPSSHNTYFNEAIFLKYTLNEPSNPHYSLNTYSYRHLL